MLPVLPVHRRLLGLYPPVPRAGGRIDRVMKLMEKKMAAILVHFSIGVARSAYGAQEEPWEDAMQQGAAPIMQSIRWFAQYTLWFIAPINLMVTLLLAWCVVRYRASRKPIPARTSHNTAIEIIWTLGPVVVLLLLAVPSFQLLTAQYTPDEEPAMTIKATSMQWYWDYEYQDEGEDEAGVSFSSLMLQEDDREAAGKEDKAAYPRLLAVDNEVVLPVNTTVRLLVTAGDVIHSFAMPSFGVKVDAVPGRINESWFRAEREGLYYGQCSELCGKDHAYMPIAIRVVSQEQYDAWQSAAQANLEDANRALMAEIESANGGDSVAGLQ